MSTWERVSGDTGDVVTGILHGVQNLVDVVTLIGAIWGCGQPPVALSGAIIDPSARTAFLSLDPWLASAVQGRWSLRWHAQFSNGDRISWPTGEPDTIVVTSP